MDMSRIGVGWLEEGEWGCLVLVVARFRNCLSQKTLSLSLSENALSLSLSLYNLLSNSPTLSNSSIVIKILCRQLTGDDLAGIDAKDLQNLENQLEASLKVIRVKKVQIV